MAKRRGSGLEGAKFRRRLPSIDTLSIFTAMRELVVEPGRQAARMVRRLDSGRAEVLATARPHGSFFPERGSLRTISTVVLAPDSAPRLRSQPFRLRRPISSPLPLSRWQRRTRRYSLRHDDAEATGTLKPMDASTRGAFSAERVFAGAASRSQCAPMTLTEYQAPPTEGKRALSALAVLRADSTLQLHKGGPGPRLLHDSRAATRGARTPCDSEPSGPGGTAPASFCAAKQPPDLRGLPATAVASDRRLGSANNTIISGQTLKSEASIQRDCRVIGRDLLGDCRPIPSARADRIELRFTITSFARPQELENASDPLAVEWPDPSPPVRTSLYAPRRPAALASARRGRDRYHMSKFGNR